MKKILFICTGNICRSPSAEAVLRHLAAAAGKDILVDSAGTGNWHIGAPPDARAADAVRARGYRMDGISARQVQQDDFDKFDIIYAMASEHLRHLKKLADDSAHEKIVLFLPTTTGDSADVPDPYFGGGDGFEEMMDLLEAGCGEIIKQLP